MDQYVTVAQPDDSPLFSDGTETSENANQNGSGDETDPEAPWGRKADGTPRRRPGRPPKEGTSGEAPAPPRTSTSTSGSGSKSGSKSSGSKSGSKSSGSKRADYKRGVRELLGLPAAALAAAGGSLGRADLVADGATVDRHADGIAQAADSVAQHDPRFAQVIERVLAGGPWAALASALVPMAAQVAVNHGVLSPGIMGTVSPETLISEMAGKNAGATV